MREDGDCLFTAVVHQVYKNLEWNSNEFKALAQQYRNLTANYLKKNTKDLEEVIMSNISDSKPSYQQKTKRGKMSAYIENLRNGKMWGGIESLYALSKILKRNITVFNEFKPGTSRDVVKSLEVQ